MLLRKLHLHHLLLLLLLWWWLLVVDWLLRSVHGVVVVLLVVGVCIMLRLLLVLLLLLLGRRMLRRRRCGIHLRHRIRLLALVHSLRLSIAGGGGDALLSDGDRDWGLRGPIHRSRRQ